MRRLIRNMRRTIGEKELKCSEMNDDVSFLICNWWAVILPKS